MENILSLKEEHIMECTKLYIRVFNDTPWNDNWNLESAGKRLRDICNSPNFEGMIYMDNDAVKGALFGNYEQYYNGIHYYIKEMFVSNDSQGMGIGSKLISCFEDVLKKNKAAAVYLLTARGSRTSRFYEKNGYQLWDGMSMMGKHLYE